MKRATRLDGTAAGQVVEQIVDRQHVGLTDRQVIRAVRDGLHPEVRNDPQHRAFRRDCYMHALFIHRRNRDLYRAVQGGTR